MTLVATAELTGGQLHGCLGRHKEGGHSSKYKRREGPWVRVLAVWTERKGEILDALCSSNIRMQLGIVGQEKGRSQR